MLNNQIAPTKILQLVWETIIFNELSKKKKSKFQFIFYILLPFLVLKIQKHVFW